MKTIFWISFPIIFSLFGFASDSIPRWRAPAVPLVTHDPYYSIWSPADQLTDAETMHWTLRDHPLRSLVRIDGEVYRLMGSLPAHVPAAKQSKCEVLPTRTQYSFEQDGVKVQLKFTSPMIATEPHLVARPITYLTWSFESVDGNPHEVEIYFSSSYLIAVDLGREKVKLEKAHKDGFDWLRVGTTAQEVLGKVGDDVRMDWGYSYVVVPAAEGWITSLSRTEESIPAFLSDKALESEFEIVESNPKNTRPELVASCTVDLVSGEVRERSLMLGYDDLYSVEYYEEPLLPYWRKEADSIQDLFKIAWKEKADLFDCCEQHDTEVLRAAEEMGGAAYAFLCAISYRQCLAAHKIVIGPDGEMLSFSKENASNGCMGTVDVFYPAAPFFLYLQPDLIKAQMDPIFEYASSDAWQWPFAPHDLGRYPKANGQVYADNGRNLDRQMPVEECGNMLILATAICLIEKSPEYANRHWEMITLWADYLLEKGFDPENQLCTDDFAGHLAHNANLSLKAIMAVAGYGKLCALRGDEQKAEECRISAKQMANDWMKAADDGDHYRLAFDKPGTWSQKYNLVWDKLLGLNLFPKEVAQKEVDYYLKIQNEYGLPLDSRLTYTKLDWIIWSATLANNREDFEALIDPVVRFADESPVRWPLSDWYWTHSAGVRGFRARSVVGGIYIKLLEEKF
ncbi:MAG: DUF4965 domain-containing protein [Opitutales bacterium]|nr:DUF4965 domain-containing protein [Opitutales bacterium]